MATLFKQMTVCGVGLIGGSLALIAKREGLVERVVGLGRTQKNLDVALERGIIDDATRDPAAAARGADLVMLAVPIRTMPETLAAMTPYLPPAAVITDVGSVKGWVVRALEPLLGPKMALVAVHPVAGKETHRRRSPRTRACSSDAARSSRRRRAARPTRSIASSGCGARPARTWSGWRPMSMTRYSRAQAICRRWSQAHSPRRSAVSGWASTRRPPTAPGGLRDTTRIAASSAEMWRDIVLTNRDAILAALKLFRGALDEFEGAIRAGDVARFEEIFNRGRAMREGLK